MSKNVFDLAQEDTSLKKVSVKEFAGPCPKCGGTDRFRVQPGRKEYGAWMCRGCWDPALKGWGDNIEYLRQMRGMSFTAAKNYLAGELDTLIERAERLNTYIEPTATGRTEPPNAKWQAWTKRYVEQAVARLWSKAGKPGLDYLHGRGLVDATIRAAQLGYEEVDDIGYIVIPWHAGAGLYWRVNKRDIRPDVPQRERYKNIAGSSNAGLYGGELLTRKYPTFLVEGELDALSIAQEASNLPINVVATGGLDCSRVPKWVARLARVPAVLIAYDNEQRGEEASKTWLKILTQNALRYRPLAKDANAMLLAGYSIRTWIQGALLLLSEDQDGEASPVESSETSSPELPELVTPDAPETCSLCSGEIDYIVDDGSYYGAAYCEQHYQALQQRAQEPALPAQAEISEASPFRSSEQFLGTVHQLAAMLEQDTGMSWHVRLLPDGYTLQDRVRELQEQDQDAVRQAWQRGHMKAG